MRTETMRTEIMMRSWPPQRRRKVAPLPLAALLALVAACASPAPPPPVHKAPAPDQGRARPDTGQIEFACEPETAVVTVDGQPRGSVAELAARGGLELERGLHRIEIAADGFRTFRLELNLGEKRETIRVKLIRVDAKP